MTTKLSEIEARCKECHLPFRPDESNLAGRHHSPNVCFDRLLEAVRERDARWERARGYLEIMCENMKMEGGDDRHVKHLDALLKEE